MTAAGFGIAVAGFGIAVAVLIGFFALRLASSVAKVESSVQRGNALTAPVERSMARSSALGATAASPDQPQTAASFAPREAPADAASVPADAAAAVVAQLDAYYTTNIHQGAAIFWASLFSMSVGFAMVLAAVAVAPANSLTAIVAGVAGVLSQFIAATFLVALRSTQQQATSFAQNLAELRLRDLALAADAAGVALGLRLLAEISADRTDPVNATKAAIAMGVIVKGSAVSIDRLPPVGTAASGGDADRHPGGGDDANERTGGSVIRTRTPTVSFDDADAAARR